MTTTDDDFFPIADQGTIERSRGLLGRHRRRAALDPVGLGYERMFVDDDGRVTGGRNLSAGEKYWANGSTWVTVDVSPHQLGFERTITDRTGKAGYVVSATVSTQVRAGQEHEVVAARAGGVRALVTPVLHEMLATGIRNATAESPPVMGPGGPPADIGQETGDELNGMRQAIEDKLRRELVGQPVHRMPDWLATDVVSLTVAFDETTAAHVNALIEQARKGLIERREVAHSIAVRDTWRNHLYEHLASGPARAIEVLLDNPTPEALQATVDQLNAAETEQRQEMRGILQLMIDNKLVDDVRDVEQWQAVKAIADALVPAGPDAPALARGSAERPRGRRDRDDVIDTVANTTEHGAVGDSAGPAPDRDWG